VKPSPRLALLLVLFHVLVAAVVYATMLPLAIRLALLLLVALSFRHYLLRDALLWAADSWRDLTLEQDRASVTCRDGSRFGGQVADETVVSPYFVLLSLRVDGRRSPVARVIFPDAMQADEFRRLRIRLKFI
jgi:hypothetical protein